MRNALVIATGLMKAPPIGQAAFNTAGTFEWTCPEGVSSICLAMMGAGGSSRLSANFNNDTSWVGNGGNLRYRNDIPVVPGQKYTIVVPAAIARNSNPALALGISSNDPIAGDLKGANGTTSTSVSATKLGCNSGGNVGGNNGLGFNLVTFTPVTTTAPGYSTTNRVGNIAGGGAGVYNGGSQYPYFGATGGIGAVRIIWGRNRKFPDQQIGNL